MYVFGTLPGFLQFSGQLPEGLPDGGLAEVCNGHRLVDNQHAAGDHAVFGNIVPVHTGLVAAHGNLRIILCQGLHECPKDLASVAGGDKFNTGMLHNPFLSVVETAYSLSLL